MCQAPKLTQPMRVHVEGVQHMAGTEKEASRGMTPLGGGLLWFGAAVSLAEIMTGTLLAPLGFARGMLAIVLGHLAGGLLMALVGLIGAWSGKPAMETVGIAFGRPGTVFFAGMNVLQLVGWSAVMIAGGAAALSQLAGMPSLAGAALIGALVALWAAVGPNRLGRLNGVAVGCLFLLAVGLAFLVFRSGTPAQEAGTGMAFGAGLELSVAMPVSWLPLMADYTRTGTRPVRLTVVSTIAYFCGSALMYAIGLGAALHAGGTDIVAVLAATGFGVAGLVVVVLATVTTTFLDVFSAGESLHAVCRAVPVKWAALAVTAIGTVAAVCLSMAAYEQFLYVIGSVFVPMAAIQVTDWFLLGHRTAARAQGRVVPNFLVWWVGFVAHRWLLTVEAPIGSTLPVLALTVTLCLAVHALAGTGKRRVPAEEGDAGEQVWNAGPDGGSAGKCGEWREQG